MVLDLVGDDRLAGDRYGLVELGNREVGYADMAREAPSLRVAERRHALAKRDGRVRPVHEQEVDPLDPEAGQAFLDRSLQRAVG